MRRRLHVRRSRQVLTVPASPSLDASGGHSATGTVFAVRRDWADGTHDFVGPELILVAAAGLWCSQHVKWRRSPHRPALSLVTISVRDFWLHAEHRLDCRAPDCPAVPPAVAA